MQTGGVLRGGVPAAGPGSPRLWLDPQVRKMEARWPGISQSV